MKRLLVIWGPVLVWMAVIFIFSSISDPFRALPREWRQERVQILTDQESSGRLSLTELIGRNGHVLEFTVLGYLIYRSVWLASGPRRVPRMVLIAVGLSFLYGVTDEIHQAFTPFRSPELDDVLLDSIGALAGALAASLVFKPRANEAHRV